MFAIDDHWRALRGSSNGDGPHIRPVDRRDIPSAARADALVISVCMLCEYVYAYDVN